MSEDELEKRFTKMYYKMPKEARNKLLIEVYDDLYGHKIKYYLCEIMDQVNKKTELGKVIITNLGFVDD